MYIQYRIFQLGIYDTHLNSRNDFIDNVHNSNNSKMNSSHLSLCISSEFSLYVLATYFKKGNKYMIAQILLIRNLWQNRDSYACIRTALLSNSVENSFKFCSNVTSKTWLVNSLTFHDQISKNSLTKRPYSELATYFRNHLSKL